VPASNQKIITAAAALAELGGDFRFTTRIAATGAVKDGQLRGDLVVSGSGDPTFSDRVRGDAAAPLREIADSIRARGITKVDGRLRRTHSVFTDSPFGFGWEWVDLGTAYGAAVGDLMYNEMYSSARVSLDGTIDGEPASVGRIAFRNFLEAFNAVLYRRGVDVRLSYDWLFPIPDSGLRPLFTYSSPPLRDILPHFLKPSQNQIGEVLIKTIGLQRTGAGTTDSGAAVTGRRLRSWGADSTSFIIRDGSGLSRHDYVSPEALVRVLDAMRRHEAFADFYNAMPVAGIDGTLDRRFGGTPAQNNARAKTGSMDRVRTLSGYVTTADGRLLMFSILANSYTAPASDVESAMDGIVAKLAALRLTN
jgi:D-alanyl-D-alanine carboxypeptidase/D-alanyl-D-alanine-endopeptidase (penicillin-binding protein 4)